MFRSKNLFIILVIIAAAIMGIFQLISPEGKRTGPETVDELVWSPDGQRLAVNCLFSKTAIQNTQTYQWLYDLPHTCNKGTFCWSPDGQRLAVGYQPRFSVFNGSKAQIRICDAKTGEVLAKYEDKTSRPVLISWSGDGTYIASAFETGDIRILDARTLSEIRMLHSQTYDASQWYSYLQWSPNSQSIALVRCKSSQPILIVTVSVWDTHSWEIISEHTGEYEANSILPQIAWSPDGYQYALVRPGGSAIVYDTLTRTEVRSISGPVYSIAWSGDGRYLLAPINKDRFKVWNGITGEEVREIDAPNVGDNLNPTILCSPSGRYTAVIAGPNIELYTCGTFDRLLTIANPREGFRSAACWSPDGQMFAFAHEITRSVQYVDMALKQVVKQVTVPTTRDE